MDIIIDKNLQEYRAKRGNTQEELAEFLSVSSQAVSKWERGESIPDVTLLPRIASYYNVSVDDLLGVGEMRKQEKIAEYEEKSMKLKNKGLIDENLKLWREAQSEFPNDMDVINHLMYALSSFNGDDKIDDEVISLGERILNESTDNDCREGAVQVLCYTHNSRGNKEKAKEYAKMGGSIWVTSETLLSDVLEGDERKEHNQYLMLEYLDCIGQTEIGLCQNQDYERYLWLHEFYLKIMELYFDDGFYGFYAVRAVQRHHWLARIYLACRHDEQKTYEHLKEAARLAKQYDDLSGEYVYTSTLLNGLKANTSGITKNYTKTESELLLDNIHDSHFDWVRERDWFKEVEAEILANIGKSLKQRLT